MDIAAASAAGLPAQTAALVTAALMALAAWQRIDDWSAPDGFVKPVIPGKQGSADDGDTAQAAALVFYENFPDLVPALTSARKASFKSTRTHLIAILITAGCRQALPQNAALQRRK